MSLRRIGPPPGAPPSLEAANQLQIDDLVQRNRTLEHKITKLTDLAAQESARAAEAMRDVARAGEERDAQWRARCTDLVAHSRIVKHYLEVEVERERRAVLAEMTITRREKLGRLQRDHKITLFQLKEEALERRVEEVEAEREIERGEAQLALEQEERRARSIASKLKETEEALDRALKERDAKEAKYNKLIEAHSNIEAASNTFETKYQRAQLKLEGSLAKVADLERANDELKRSNTDLINQLDRWQNLETKGGEAQEKEHKKRIALELAHKELKEQFAAQEQELEKAQKKVTKIKDVSLNYESEVKEQKTLVSEANKQISKLEKQVDKLEKLVDKLKGDLEAERARVRPRTPQRAATPQEPSAEDISDASPPPPPPKSKSKSNSKTSTKAGPSSLPARPRLQMGRKSVSRKTPESDTESEAVEEVPEPAPSKKGKGKAKEIEVDDDSVEEVEPVPRKRTKRPTNEDSGGEAQVVEPKATRKKPAAKAKPASKAKDDAKPAPKSKADARGGSKQPVASTEVEEEPKKKKRKIIFPTGNAPGPFAFESLKQYDDGLLDIPQMLSPLKPGEPVPQRSTSIMKALGRK